MRDCKGIGYMMNKLNSVSVACSAGVYLPCFKKPQKLKPTLNTENPKKSIPSGTQS